MRQLELWSKMGRLLAERGAAMAPTRGRPDGQPHAHGKLPAVPPLPTDDRQLAAWLGARLGKPVRLVLTDNRSTMLSCREVRGVMVVRLQRLFLAASEAELKALVDYLGGYSAEAGLVLDAFIKRAKPARTASTRCRPRGRFFDLQALFDKLNERYFHSAVQARITWGVASGRRFRRSIQLGSYLADERLIRIHPCLDQAFVPHHYLSWVVFHEMLHDVFGLEGTDGGRRKMHPPEFVAVEESYPDFARCRAWEEAHMHRLLRYRPS